MTKENDYGMQVEVADDYDFPGWTWGNVPEDVIRAVCVDAAKTVLDDFCKQAYLTIDEAKTGGCYIRLQWGDDIAMRRSLSDLIDSWIRSRVGGDTLHPDDAKPLVEALEAALARIKPLIRR